MRLFLKITAVIIVLLLATALFAPLLLRDKIVEIVKHEANAALNARLDFEKLDISLLRHFPSASVDIKRLTIRGVARFEADTLVAAERISVVVNLMSLLGDDGVEVTKVILSRPEVHARKLADGLINWDIVKPVDKGAKTTQESQESISSYKLSIKEFRIKNAVLSYRDDSTGIRLGSSATNLRLKGDLSDRATSLDLNLSARNLYLASGGMMLLRNTDIELDARVLADMENRRFTLANNTLRLNAIKVSLDGWAQLQENAVDMDFTAACEKVQFKEVLSLIPVLYTGDFKDLSAAGELSLSAWIKGSLHDDKLPAFEIALAVQNGSFQYSSLPKAVTKINLDVKVANPGDLLDKTTIDISKFGFTMAENAVTASFFASHPISDPYFRGAVSGKFNLGAVKEFYPQKKETDMSGVILANIKGEGRMSDVEAGNYEQISASGNFVVEGVSANAKGFPELKIRRAAASITPTTMTLGEFGVTVGQSDISANGQVTNYIGYLLRDEPLSGRLYVKSDLLDLNEIFPAAPANAESGMEAEIEDISVVEVPRNLNLSLSTDLRKVLYQNMVISNISGEMRLADGALSLNGLRINIFDGNATASGSYSTAADPQRPMLKMKLGITNASFSKTFAELETMQKLVPLFEKTGGDYSASLDLATRLDSSMSPELTTLNASGEISSAHISIHNIGAFDALATALNNDALRNVEARDVTIRFTIRDGRITTEPFDLQLGEIGLTLSGSTGLDQRIDYAARVSLPESLSGGLLSSLNVGIGGTFSAPKITLGVREAATEAITNAVNDQLQKLTGSETLNEEVQKQIAKLRNEAQKTGEKLIKAAQEQKDKLVVAAKNPLAKFAAEKAGDKLIEMAEKQAAALNTEAENQIEKLTPKTK